MRAEVKKVEEDLKNSKKDHENLTKKHQEEIDHIKVRVVELFLTVSSRC